MTLQVGDKAPEFTVRSPGGDVSLSSFEGKPVVLAFYALAFTGG